MKIWPRMEAKRGTEVISIQNLSLSSHMKSNDDPISIYYEVAYPFMWRRGFLM